MNEMFFSAKRAFHGTLRICRKPLRSLGLTAARYDMMYVLMGRNGDDPRPTFSQRGVRLQLGVCRSVVSRMLRSLEELGWVTRQVAPRDKRQRWVTLTEAGLRVIRAAVQALARASMRLVYMAICLGGNERDPNEQFIHMAAVESYLHAIRGHYGDTARLYYPWGHPDD
jgi:DNA-binding MarR family transcriptional regulator